MWVKWESVSAWKWKGKKCPPLEYQTPIIEKDIEDVNEGMDLFDTALDKVKCKTRHMLEGNHDDWTNRFVSRYPYMAQYAFKNAVSLKKRGLLYHTYNKPLKIGKVNFIHGAYATTYHAKNIWKPMVLILFMVIPMIYRDITLTKLDSGTIGAWSIRCLKDMR